MADPVVDERIYREVVSRAEAGKLPLYPSAIRKKVITRYKAEKVAELERVRTETERKIAEERQRRARAERKRHERWEKEQTELQKASEADKWKVHTGSWIKITKEGNVSGRTMAAMSPSEAKARGFKWGSGEPKEGGGYKFVSLPGEPTDAEYYGILEWKFEKGQYAHSPETEQQIIKEIELGGKEFGIVAPAWAGGYTKQYEAAAKVIKAAYTKAAESERKPAPAELKKAGAPPTSRPVTKQDVSKYQELATLGQHPDVQAHITAMQKLQTESEQLQTRGAELQRQTRVQNELVTGADKAFEEYAKDGWTHEEVISYGFLAGAIRGAGKELEPQLAKYQEKAGVYETALKMVPTSPTVKQFEAASKAFMEQYTPAQITEMGKAMIVTFPDEKSPPPTKEPKMTYGALGQFIRHTGVIPTFTPQEKPEVRPTATERLVEKGKHITGYYPEKRTEYGASISAYGAQQLGLADSLGVTHRERGTGKRYITVNGTKYTEGTKGFSEHLGGAIQGAYPMQPLEVKTRQEALQEAARMKAEFTDIYGGKAGEPIILLTPESREAFKGLETTFEGIPEENITTKAYWAEVEKMREVQPQIEQLNVLAEQATHQAKEMEKIQEEKWFGVPHKVETIEEKHTPPKLKEIGEIASAYARVESAGDYLEAYEMTGRYFDSKPLSGQEQKKVEEAWKEGQQISRDYRKMWGLSPDPYEWERKAGQLSAGFKAGQIKEITEHPIKGAVTIASFAALPAIFKGAGYLWGARAGGKAVGMAAKTPRLTKGLPKLAMGGMGTVYGGMVGMEVYKAPTMELKGEVLGRTSIELAEMGFGTTLGIKAPRYIHSFAKSRSFPFQSLDVLIADTTPIGRLRKKYALDQALGKKQALEQAGRDAKFKSGEWKPIKTRGGVLVQKMIPKLEGKAKVGVGHRKSRLQTRTTAKAKRAEAKRMKGYSRKSHSPERELTKTAKMAIERERARMVEAQKDPIKKPKPEEPQKSRMMDAEKAFLRMSQELFTKQGVGLLLLPKIGYSSLTLQTQKPQQDTFQLQGAKQISQTITEQKHATKQKEATLEEAMTKQLQKAKQLLSLKQVPISLLGQKELLLGETMTKQKQLQKTDMKTITEKMPAIEFLRFKKPKIPKIPKLPEVPIIPLIPPPSKKKKAPKRKKHTRKREPYEWFVKHRIPTLEEVFAQPTHGKTRHRIVAPDGADMMNRVLNDVPEEFK